MAHKCDLHNCRVVDSRSSNGTIRRRRECPTCGKRISTFELPVDEVYKLAHAQSLANRIEPVESALDDFLMSI